MNPITFSEELKGLGVHEAYHVLQYRYVYEHGGSKAIKKLLEDVRKVNYEDNILEEGAYGLQYFGIKQDFEKVFAPYIEK